jgi:hypothetical protein
MRLGAQKMVLRDDLIGFSNRQGANVSGRSPARLSPQAEASHCNAAYKKTSSSKLLLPSNQSLTLLLAAVTLL